MKKPTWWTTFGKNIGHEKATRRDGELFGLGPSMFWGYGRSVLAQSWPQHQLLNLQKSAAPPNPREGAQGLSQEAPIAGLLFLAP